METKISNWKTDWLRCNPRNKYFRKYSTKRSRTIVSKYESCAQAYEDFKKVEKQQQSIQEQIIIYEEKVKNVLRTS